jgi:hypothetical protein
MGLSDNQLWAIEVKTKCGGRTDLAHGLLEAYGYGELLHLHAKNGKDMTAEIDSCLRAFHGSRTAGSRSHPLSTSYALAAPRSYYAEYFGQGAITPEKARRRRVEVRVIESALKEQTGSMTPFIGFLLIEQDPTKVKSRIVAGRTVPFFEPAVQEVRLCRDIDALQAEVCGGEK